MGLRGGLDRALMFMLILMIQQYAAISIGLLIASIFADPALASTVVGPILALNILLDGGEINKIIPGVLRWLQYLTISFYAQNALFLNEFEGITLEDGTSSDQVLANFGYGSLTKLESMGYLVIYALLCQFAGIVILKLSCNHYNKKYNKI